MVYTLTLNPALDYHLFFDDFRLEQLNVPSHVSMHAGGKGLNVARVLTRFGVTCKCIGFVGGFTGDFICKDLTDAHIPHDFIHVSGNTRVNVKMNNGGSETEISGCSPFIAQEFWVELLNKIIQVIKPGDVLVLSGSIPESLSDNAYASIIELCPAGVRLFLDTRGSSLRVSLSNSKAVYAVKPNWKELEDWFGSKLVSFEDLIGAARKMLKFGVEYVLLSMGNRGAALVSEHGAYRIDAPEGQLISSVGSGDAMLAGYIYAEEMGMTLSDRLLYAVAAGSATAFTDGLCTAESVQQLIKNGIHVESILEYNR